MYNQITSNKRKTVVLMMVFIAVILGLGTALGAIYGDAYGGIAIALIISFFMNIIGYYKGDAIALRSSGAKEIQKNDNPYVYRMVENLCITAGMPVPKVYIIPTTAMNAFATGRDPQHASIALTQGIIDKLENEELEGVIAHELAHIKNYDIRTMTIVVVLVGTIIMLADWLMRAHFFRKNDNGKSNPIFLILGIVLAILSPLLAQLIQLAISRKREFLADATGALLTRYPDGLASALQKISQDPNDFPKASKATAHLFISNPLKNKTSLTKKLFSTHPPVEERIAALRDMT